MAAHLLMLAIIGSFILPSWADSFSRNKTFIHERSRRQSGSGCNYNFKFDKVGDNAFLRSPGYPGSYGPNIACRYNIASPSNTQMNIECTDFNLESSQNCQYDAFFISPSGDTTFSDQRYYCGSGSLTTSTTGTNLAIFFKSDESNPQSNQPFRFQCKITVVPAKQICNCGVRNLQSRIVGGSAAAVGEFPWRCALYSRLLGVFCGCSVISNKWILTAAHCTNGVQPGDQIYVNVGDHDLSRQDEAQNQVIPVDYVIQNNLYNDQTQDADISLLRLQTPLNFSRNIAPVCLPWKFQNQDFDGQTVVASGWGSRFYGAGITPVLQKVDNLPVLGPANCYRYYSGSSVTVTNNMICTYDPPRDTCQGDSGTSIDYFNGRYYAIGVTSNGVGCGTQNRPGIYTNVGRYLNWIQGNTGETFCRI